MKQKLVLLPKTQGVLNNPGENIKLARLRSNLLVPIVMAALFDH